MNKLKRGGAMNKVTIIDGVTVVNITPELSPEERKKRVREIAEGLIAIGKNREKDKTA